MSYVVITGASSGIGMEFAKEFAKQGYSLVLVARRIDRLNKLKEDLNCEVLVLPHDLNQKEECYKLLDEISALDIDYFINNAGFGDFSIFNEITDERLNSMIDVNVKALSILTKGVLNMMLLKNKGSILNVASSAGLYPGGAYMAEYYATKAYVRSLTLGISEELKMLKSKVYIGALCPGPINTEFNKVANVEFSLKGLSASACVKYTIKMMHKKRRLIIPGVSLRLAYFFQRFVSTNFLLSMVRHQQKKKIYH